MTNLPTANTQPGSNCQVKLDYGFPIEELEGSDKNGRFHFAFEAQF